MEVAPGIHRIEAPLGSRIIAVYLLLGNQAALLIDTGIDATVTSTVLPYLASLSMPYQQLRYGAPATALELANRRLVPTMGDWPPVWRCMP